MVIDFSTGKLILSVNDIHVKLNQSTVSLYAMAEDLKVFQDALMLVADAGAVCWSIKLDDSQQLEQVINQLGLATQ
ncbi:DUF3389 domain-containing protein [Shewanella sp. AS1]|uniref:DUF3389 family protein n=1 Tax=Shewanella sp. AS1 TaxID=2907626 RepID=UPI001F34C7CE|nr:DUF3389 family protein [Shewanella sp. AS1]MCE9678564.1 DUF3389 domain-containing protein [Shewanella sp. AS1]